MVASSESELKTVKKSVIRQKILKMSSDIVQLQHAIIILKMHVLLLFKILIRVDRAHFYVLCCHLKLAFKRFEDIFFYLIQCLYYIHPHKCHSLEAATGNFRYCGVKVCTLICTAKMIILS